MNRPVIGIVVPTKNSGSLISAHVEMLRTLMPLVSQVVVVDSFSTDGTVDVLRTGLDHPDIRFLQHPPGLYQSWNHGVAALRTEYCYISTVGDSITPGGLMNLAETASRLGSDVVISKPRFIDNFGRDIPPPRWPVHAIEEILAIKSDAALTRIQSMASAYLSGFGALTGSCASNLFRTSALQANPFPHEFGTNGDGAWGIVNAGTLNWAVSPVECSTFRAHPTFAGESDVARARARLPFEGLFARMLEGALEQGGVTPNDLVESGSDRLRDAFLAWHGFRAAFDEQRRGKWPWALNPFAWSNRMKRNVAWRRLSTQVADVLQSGREPSRFESSATGFPQNR